MSWRRSRPCCLRVWVLMCRRRGLRERGSLSARTMTMRSLRCRLGQAAAGLLQTAGIQPIPSISRSASLAMSPLFNFANRVTCEGAVRSGSSTAGAQSSPRDPSPRPPPAACAGRRWLSIVFEVAIPSNQGLTKTSRYLAIVLEGPQFTPTRS